MRVLHVVRTFGHGGMERNVRRVIVATEARGLQHTILLLNDQADILEMPPSCPIHRAVTRPRDPRMVLRIAEVIAAVRPTVIHARNWGAWPDTALARLLTRPRVPLIFSYHGMEARALPATRRAGFQVIEKLTSRIFTVSESARRLLVEEVGLPRARVGVIENGVDTARFAPAREPGPHESPRDKVVIGTVGRLFEIKNIPLLIRAVERAARRRADLELRIAGEGPEEARCRALARALGFERNVVFEGRVEDTPSFLRGLDLFVLSSDNEASPNALLEAMATGLPCVTTSVGGARDAADGGRACHLVEPGDERGLAAAIEHLVESPARRRELGAAARARVIARYDQAHMLAAYEALYRAPLDPPAPIG